MSKVGVKDEFFKVSEGKKLYIKPLNEYVVNGGVIQITSRQTSPRILHKGNGIDGEFYIPQPYEESRPITSQDDCLTNTQMSETGPIFNEILVNRLP